MRKLIVAEHISLDGVIQGPGSPEEDPSGGFRFGGWRTYGLRIGRACRPATRSPTSSTTCRNMSLCIERMRSAGRTAMP